MNNCYLSTKEQFKKRRFGRVKKRHGIRPWNVTFTSEGWRWSPTVENNTFASHTFSLQFCWIPSSQPQIKKNPSGSQSLPEVQPTCQETETGGVEYMPGIIAKTRWKKKSFPDNNSLSSPRACVIVWNQPCLLTFQRFPKPAEPLSVSFLPSRFSFESSLRLVM